MDAILLAAGNSRRMGAGVDKQTVRIGGKPAMVISLERLLSHPAIDRVIVTSQVGNLDNVRSLLGDYRLDQHCVVVAGGASRQESVRCGLAEVISERVLVHEGARPLIDDALIERVVVTPGDAVVPTIEVPFTVAVGGVTMTGELDRSTLHNIQLPQAFDTAVLRLAHEEAAATDETATEDSMLVFRRGHEVVFVQGSQRNIKITIPEDLQVAESLIFGEQEN